MTTTELKNNINTRVQAIQTIVAGQPANVGAAVSEILAEEIEKFAKDLTIIVTVPALPVTEGSTQQVELTAIIQAL